MRRLWCCWINWVVILAQSHLRPDFLARCQPAVPDPLTAQYGLPAVDNPACQAPPSGELTDGHYRRAAPPQGPSGHAHRPARRGRRQCGSAWACVEVEVAALVCVYM